MKTTEIINDRKEMDKAIEEAISKFMEKHTQFRVTHIEAKSNHVTHIRTGVAELSCLEVKTTIEFI